MVGVLVTVGLGVLSIQHSQAFPYTFPQLIQLLRAFLGHPSPLLAHLALPFWLALFRHSLFPKVFPAPTDESNPLQGDWWRE